MNPQFFYLAGVSRIGTVKVPVMDIKLFYLNISTRRGNIRIRKGDGSAEVYYTTTKMIDATQNIPNAYTLNYTEPFSGDIELDILQGKNDVYSIQFGYSVSGDNYTNKLNIQDFGAFLRQFPSLYSFNTKLYAYQNPEFMGIIKGNLLDIPESVERVLIGETEVFNAINDLVIDFNGIPANSRLKWLHRADTAGNSSYKNIRILGDIAKVPLGCSFIRIAQAASGSAITYTGKTWSNEFDTLSVYAPATSNWTFLQADPLLKDMSRDITTATGDKVINITGWVSEDAKSSVNALISKGFNVSGILKTYEDASSTTQKLNGDLATIPNTVKKFKVSQAAPGSAVTYTGKTWTSEFDTLSVPAPVTIPDNDSMLQDMARDILTKIGDGIIHNTYFRTNASDSAVAQLTARGFNVKIPKINSYLLQMPLSDSLLDVYGHNATAIGTETHEEGGLRTKNNQAAFIPQTTDLDIGVDSIHFGCTFKIKNLTSVSGLVGKSIAASINGRYAIFMRDGELSMLVHDVGSKTISTPITPLNDANFHKVEGIYDRTRGFMSMIVDGLQVAQTVIPSSSSNITCNARFHIGAYGNASGTAPQPNFFFDGIIKDVFFNKF